MNLVSKTDSSCEVVFAISDFIFPGEVRTSLLDRLRNFNYFSKSSATTNEQIIATRVFCLLLLVSSVILITYYGTERVVTIYQIESPIFEQFIDLQSDQQSNPSFSCPCSTITSMYENIIDVTYTLHPLCSSDFVYKLNIITFSTIFVL